MKSVLATLAFIGAAVAQLTINTPSSPTVCVPLALTFSGGESPYFVSVIPGGQPSAAALLQFAPTSEDSITWTVNITAGTNITLKVTDSIGNTAFSAPTVIEQGTSTSCLNNGGGSTSSSSGSSSVSSTTTTTLSTSSSEPTTTTASATTATSTTTSHSSSSSSSSTTSSAASTTPTNAQGSSSGAGMITAPLALVLGILALVA